MCSGGSFVTTTSRYTSQPALANAIVHAPQIGSMTAWYSFCALGFTTQEETGNYWFLSVELQMWDYQSIFEEIGLNSIVCQRIQYFMFMSVSNGDGSDIPL